ncbi:hypothetical protein RJ640_026403 [Escallonia rubra]|uniref:Uncharacterized protein n=1 Tax=Escallonia rubra TaxID=112253 RepID=A0AA88U5R4_9ASTE|nr:hypothetical protein RJ640_026403 [Escallonia rubra]
MSANEDDSMVNRAIESGAFRKIEKPVTKGALKYLWQHVMRERMMRKNNKTGNKGVRHLEISMVGENHKLDDQSKGKQLEEDKGSETNNRDDDGTSTKKLKSRKYARKNEKGESTNKTKAGRVRRKVCTEWTDELHSKFMDAVGQLGEGRCYPKEILEHMNVPGLTRMQVASHLQKCRNANWRAPEERKSLPPCAPTSSNPHQHVPPRKFGSMPHLLKKPNSAQPHLHEGPEIYPSVEMDQHMNPQPYLMPEEYGSQPLPQNFGMQNMEQIGSGVEDICNAVDQSDIFNVGTHGNGGTLAGMAYHQTFNPILPNFSNATFGTSSHVGSSSQRQPPAESFGIFSELDDLPPSYSIFPEGSLIPQSLTTQDSISNFEAYSQQTYTVEASSSRPLMSLVVTRVTLLVTSLVPLLLLMIAATYLLPTSLIIDCLRRATLRPTVSPIFGTLVPWRAWPFTLLEVSQPLDNRHDRSQVVRFPSPQLCATHCCNPSTKKHSRCLSDISKRDWVKERKGERHLIERMSINSTRFHSKCFVSFPFDE